MSDTKTQLYIKKSGRLEPIEPKTIIPAVEGGESLPSLSEILNNLGRGEKILIGRTGNRSFFYSPDSGALLLLTDEEAVYISKAPANLSLDRIAEHIAVQNPKLTRIITENMITDDLTSTASDRPLSANQGRVLKEMMAGMDTWDGTKAEWNALTEQQRAAIGTAYITED